MSEWNYSKEKMELKHSVYFGRKNKIVDIVIFKKIMTICYFIIEKLKNQSLKMKNNN